MSLRKVTIGLVTYVEQTAHKAGHIYTGRTGLGALALALLHGKKAQAVRVFAGAWLWAAKVIVRQQQCNRNMMAGSSVLFYDSRSKIENVLFLATPSIFSDTFIFLPFLMWKSRLHEVMWQSYFITLSSAAFLVWLPLFNLVVLIKAFCAHDCICMHVFKSDVCTTHVCVHDHINVREHVSGPREQPFSCLPSISWVSKAMPPLLLQP